MREIRYAAVNGKEIPVLISDENEALLAARAAGGAIVGLWSGEGRGTAAPYAVEALSDVTEEFLERAARRHLGLPWRICETRRLLVREMTGDDFDEVWANQVGRGFGSVEELEAYTKHQYTFYEFGFWALVEKETGDLIGVAGLKVPEEDGKEEPELVKLELFNGRENAGDGEVLELGHHIFPAYRRRGYGLESCAGILNMAAGVGGDWFLVRIRKENVPSPAEKAISGKISQGQI
ncbi:MAG: GNAT family N-acetyltransferase [Enterocloster sp.]